ncbi:hypothetical protein BJ138DRAFT_1072168 [Hygrophoropsis aurantiaca]|uniref:Uncharacterized protein n=1 Tax=Hygrophoropsis aurantiaca TaxID=72124 RepID=A0ACB7ZYB5_9AGAM|nr:hypothetical protein BJ138DRAFT_1072168 [Hygrophoropsis aurantiaca]
MHNHEYSSNTLEPLAAKALTWNNNGFIAKLCEIKESVEDLQHPVQSPSSSPAVLRMAIAAVTAEHTNNDNPFALIYRLPTEILVMIFELAGHVSLDPDFPCSCYSEQQPSELNISHVSRRWRDIAINAPSLWTKWCNRITQSSNLLSIYFHRSSNRKVDVELYTLNFEAQTPMSVCWACASEGQDGKYHAVSELLETSTHRFRSLQIISVIIGSPMAKLLERLALTVSASLTPSFASLTGLAMHGEPEFSNNSDERQTLWNFQEFRDILSACPNLIVLELRNAFVSCPETMDPTGTECIELPSLTHLCFEMVDEPSDLYSTRILATLTAPKLRHFECLHNFPEEDVDQLLYAFFKSDHTPRFPTVQELTLNTFGAYDDDNIFEEHDAFFEVVIKAFPRVTDVTLANTDIIPCSMALTGILEASEGGSAADPWPCLKRLSIHRPSRNGLFAIIIWLKERSKRIHQPQRLSFKVDGPDIWRHFNPELNAMEMYGDLTFETLP